MENRFDNKDFEQFVKQNADQYRMFPSEKVWEGIHQSIHTRSRWYGIGLGLLILTTGVVTFVMLTNAGKNKPVAMTLPEIRNQQVVTVKEQKPEMVIVNSPSPAEKNSFITAPDKLHKTIYLTPDPITAKPELTPVSESTAIAIKELTPVVEKAETTPVPEIIAKTVPQTRPSHPAKPVTNTIVPEKVFTSSFITIQEPSRAEPVPTVTEDRSLDKKDSYPLTIESVINSYTFTPKRKKISLQLYFTPSISYRQLKENKTFINAARNSVSNSVNSYNYYATDINNVVTHKPDVGLQLGFIAGYPLTRNLKLIGGLQFNVSKYDIKAYSYPSEVATIALQNTAGGTNTVSTVTNYRNTGGFKANWLHNLYFSASAPIGLELKLAGRRKTYFGVSGTAQPTYMISNRSYLLSTDYKNYAEIPSLIRKWNINTAFELFAGYSTGKLKWRVGPQVRYQTMSSFQKKYPVQEHLFDFGIKLGVFFNK